jgi:hypothetical protein
VSAAEVMELVADETFRGLLALPSITFPLRRTRRRQMSRSGGVGEVPVGTGTCGCLGEGLHYALLRALSKFDRAPT